MSSEAMENNAGTIVTSGNTLGQKAAPRPRKKAAVAKNVTPESDKLLVFSDGNMHWDGMAIEKGYNVLTKRQAEKWLTNRKVREATAEEVLEFYGK